MPMVQDINSASIDLALIRKLADVADISTPPRRFVALLEWVHAQVTEAYLEGRAADTDIEVVASEVDLFGKPLVAGDPPGTCTSGRVAGTTAAVAPQIVPPPQPASPAAMEVPAGAPPRKKGEAWTEDEIQTAIDMDRAGNTARKIAAVLGRPLEGTRAKLKTMAPEKRGRYGDAPPPRGAAAIRKDAWTSDLDERLVLLKTSGASIAEMARDLDRSEGAISMRLRVLRGRREAPSLAKESWTPEEDKALLDGRSAGRPFREIGHDLGRTVKALHSRHHRLTTDGAQSEPEAPTAPVPAPEPEPKAEIDIPADAPVPTAPADAPAGAGRRVADLGDISAMTARQSRLLSHLDRMSDDFAPVDDQDIIEGLAAGKKADTIADELGCGPRDVINRWRRMLTEDVVNSAGKITLDGQADLLAACRHLVAMAAVRHG